MTREELQQLGKLAMKYAGEVNNQVRTKKLSRQRRSEIARKASRARWGKKEKAIA